MARKPSKKFSELSPAYRARLERSFKSGSFGQGYTSAGRAYAAGASRQAARGQASTRPGKASEAERTQLRKLGRKAKAWSDVHGQRDGSPWFYDPPKDPQTALEYTRTYVAATKEMDKAWKRQAIDFSIIQKYFKDYNINGGVVDYFSISP